MAKGKGAGKEIKCRTCGKVFSGGRAASVHYAETTACQDDIWKEQQKKKAAHFRYSVQNIRVSIFRTATETMIDALAKLVKEVNDKRAELKRVEELKAEITKIDAQRKALETLIGGTADGKAALEAARQAATTPPI